MLDTEGEDRRNSDGRGVLFVFDLSQEVKPLEIAAGRCFRASESDLQRIERAMHASGDYPPGEPRRRWRNGRVPYVAAMDAEIASYGWVTREPEPMDDLGVSFTAPAGDVWLYDFATVPEFRGRRLYPALLRHILQELKEQGVKRAWIGTEPGNIASEHGISRAGFIRAAETKFVRRPGSGHFVIHAPTGVPHEIVRAAAGTVSGRIAE